MIDMINKKNVGWTAGINERFAGAKIKDVRACRERCACAGAE